MGEHDANKTICVKEEVSVLSYDQMKLGSKFDVIFHECT